LPGPITSGGGSTGGTPTLANSPAEQQLMDVLLAPAMAGQPVPSWGGFLVGPLYRGVEVELK
jgi:hypothetical protein